MPELTNAFAEIDDSERRSTIERVVTSYRHPWDVYAELIQNAVDAVDDEAERVGSGEFLGDLKIEIDTAARRIVVEDNGRGIQPDRIGTLVATGKSLKRGTPRRFGFMGFGLTFIAFQSAYLRIQSVCDGMKSVRTYRDLYKYVFADKAIALAEAEEDGATPIPVDEPNGTRVEVVFPAEFPREDKEHDIAEAFEVAKNESLFEVALRTKTAIGNTQKIFGKDPAAEISVTVTVDGSVYEVPFKFFDYAEALAASGITEGQWISLEDFNKLVALTENVPSEQQQLKRQEAAIFYKAMDRFVGERKPLQFDMYIFATSKNRLNSFNHAIKAVPGDADEDDTSVGWGVTNGVLLALDGMPTSIRLDDWKHPNYWPFSVLIDAKDMSRELDAGRKGISVSRREQIMKYVSEQLSSLGFRRYARYVTHGTLPTDTIASDREEWTEAFVKAEKHLPQDSAVYVPLTVEQEVIALFFDLLGRGRLRGYALKMLSSHRTYDALMDYRLQANGEGLYDRQNNPLGVLPMTFQSYDSGVVARPNAVVEFKLTLDGFYADITRVAHNKDLNEIDLLVCWTARPEAGQQYGDSVDLIQPNQRHFYGATHRIIMSGRSKPLQVMALKDVLDLLGTP